MRTACLVGNGVSIAYNNALTTDALTTDLLALFAHAGATDADQALAAFAASLAMVEGDQFEALLGPLSTTAEALAYLPGVAALAQAAAPDEVVVALDTVTNFLRDVHRAGMAITLSQIAARTLGGAYNDVILRMANELIALGPAEELMVGTLNYDGLLHSGFLEAGTEALGQTVYPVSDLAAGYDAHHHMVVPGHDILGHPLRETDDLMPNTAQLVQLHGSLGWLRDPAHPEDVWRFTLDDLRTALYWDAWRAGTTDWAPIVVLTDRKDRAVAGWPYSLAYEIFQRRLINAERWLIVGYGLGDLPVNLLYRTALKERARHGLGAPLTLVVGYVADADLLRERAHDELKIPNAALSASAVGVPAAFDSAEWADWKA